MTSQTDPKSERTILLADSDVIIRFAIASHLRRCGFTVIETVSGSEARAVLVSGLKPGILLSDALLADEDNGFALAQWVRRHRKEIEVVLMGTLANKVQAACDLCTWSGAGKSANDAQQLTAKIQAMMAERKRRLRAAPRTAPTFTAKRKRS